MRDSEMSPTEIGVVRERVKAAFKALRKAGFIARANLACCMSCAIAELNEIAEKQHRDRAAYWHRQDDESFRKGQPLHIRFCYLPEKETDENTTVIEKEIGEQVADALRNAGLLIEWDGNPAKTIQVTGAAKLPEKEDQRGGAV